MESSVSNGAFSQEFDSPEEDPFATSDADFGITGDVPVVDREGNPVEAEKPAEQPPPAEQPAQAEPPAEQPAEVEQPAEQAPPAEAATPPVADEQPAADATQVAAESQAAESVIEQAEAAPAVEAAPAEAERPEVSVTAEPEEAPESDTAAPPTPKAKDSRRRYVLFTPDGNGKFSEVVWHEDKSGKPVTKGTPGAKKQTVTLARGQEDALRFGHEVMGSPADGVSLVAVAATYWQVRHVKPDPIQPVKQRLKIS